MGKNIGRDNKTMFDNLDAYKDHFDDLSDIFEKLIGYIKESLDSWLKK